MSSVCWMWRVARDALALIDAQHRLEVPHLLHLAAAMLCIPVQTATVERGFSMNRLFKHKLSNRMRLITLDSMTRVCMLMKGEVSEFDFDAAVHIVEDCGGMRSGSHPLTHNWQAV